MLGVTIPEQGGKKEKGKKQVFSFLTAVTSSASKTPMDQALEAVTLLKKSAVVVCLPPLYLLFVSSSSPPLLPLCLRWYRLPWSWPSGVLSLLCREPRVTILAHCPNPPALNSLTHNALGSLCFLVNVLKRIIVVSQLQARYEATAWWSVQLYWELKLSTLVCTPLTGLRSSTFFRLI